LKQIINKEIVERLGGFHSAKILMYSVDFAELEENMERAIDEFVKRAKEILQDNLTGIYLHGSAVMGCYNPEKSDLDLIVVVNEPMTDEVKRRFMDMVVEVNQEGHEKGIEMSVVTKSVCKPFVYPTPFELHFSEMHTNWYKDNQEDYIQKMKGTDKDLAAHFTIISKRGKCLCGLPIEEVFAPVPKADYFDSIWEDIAEAQEDILDNTMYIILNLARVLAYKKEGLILSKKEGGEWALNNTPEEFHPLIQAAMQEYADAVDVSYDYEVARNYAAYMIKEIRNDQSTTYNG
jgi:streptomycin 3"-adenylyltransferase